ncbi:MAG: hypothetical protein JSR82_10550 [Verrucomicrobia bacterium]|nr:hypothetical protein [Verrucomicrobiota bacterium]
MPTPLPAPDAERGRIVILGAGCAGLALARQLEVQGYSGEVVLLEERSREAALASTQRWCFWGAEPDPLLAPAVSAVWPEWQARLGEHAGVLGDPAWTYRQIRARDYHRLLETLLTARGWRIEHGWRILGRERLNRGWIVQTERGPWFADEVVEARGPALAEPAGSAGAAARQTFAGWEIELERPTFGAGVATLMDFQPTSGGRVRFLYLLPYSDRTALVEFTEIAPVTRASSVAELEAGLERCLAARGWRGRLLEREKGHLPLWEARRGVGRIGAAGGAVRASSGYGFLCSWEQAEREARRLCGKPARPIAGHRVLRWLDRVFLRVLEHDPEALPGAFVDLFRRVPAASLARFLNGYPTATDLLRVVAAMPLRPFLRAAARPLARDSSARRPTEPLPAA